MLTWLLAKWRLYSLELSNRSNGRIMSTKANFLAKFPVLY